MNSATDYPARLAFARVSGIQSTLRESWTIIQPALGGIFDRFYDHVQSVSALAALVRLHLVRLKKAQEAHWTRLFSGSFDDHYLESVYRIGQVHSRIGLEPRWFIAGYQFILTELTEIVSHKRHGDALRTAVAAITRAVMLDVDLVISAYLDAVNTEREHEVARVSEEISREILSGIETFQAFVLDQSARVTQTSATSEQIVANLTRMNDLVEEQSANVTQTSASVEEVMANIVSVNSIVSQMSQVFSHMSEAAADGKVKIRGVVSATRQLLEESKNLQNANTAIKEVAAKTNLLAMNAAIEAAHAGHLGAGFAVVAHEIRVLATQATQQSTEIHANIAAMERFITACEVAANNADQSFERMMDHYQTLQQRSQKITDSMAEQTEGSRQILVATGEMNRITSEVKNHSFEMLTGGRAIQEEMAAVLAASEQVRQQTTKLIVKVESIASTVTMAHADRP